MIAAFISEQRDRFGVAPICRALSAHGVPIAPRTYYAHLSGPPSARSLWDIAIIEILAGIFKLPYRHSAGRRPCSSGS